MRSWIFLALAVAVAGYGLRPDAEATAGRADYATVVGRVVGASNTIDKGRGVPDRWRIDVDGDGSIDMTLYDRDEQLLSELVTPGVNVEAVVDLTELKDRKYRLLSWVRVGRFGR